MVTLAQLNERELKWLEAWVDGLARFYAKSPKETKPITDGQVFTIRNIIFEKQDFLPEMAKRWREGMDKASIERAGVKLESLL